MGTSLALQWLGLYVSIMGVQILYLVREPKIPQAMQCGQKSEREREKQILKMLARQFRPKNLLSPLNDLPI